MSTNDYVIILGALTTFVGALATAAVAIIGALKRNTIATEASTAATKARIVQVANEITPLDDPADAIKHMNELVAALVNANVKP